MTIKKLIAGPLGSASNSTGADIAESVNSLASISFSALGGVVSKIKNAAGDSVILVMTDSTGNSDTEWVYLYAQYLATLNTQYRVEYYTFNEATGQYRAAVVLQAGAGVGTLRLYNAAIAGTKPDYIMGARFANAVVNIPKADCLIMSHGHNCASSYSGSDPINQRTPQLIEGPLQALAHHSGASLVYVTQNPLRDNDVYLPVYRAILRAAALLGASVADSYTLFIQAGKNPSLYLDNTHPSPAGTQLFLSAIKNLTIDGIHHSAISALDGTTKKNLLLNGDFAAFSGAIPDGWTLSDATCTKNTTDFDGLNGYSVSVTTTAAVGGLSQNLPANALKFVKGKIITLAVRVFIPEGQANTAGRIGLLSNSANANNYAPSADPRNGWVWRIVSLQVSPTDTYVTVKLYGDSAGNNGVAYFDRAVLVIGSLPSDCI